MREARADYTKRSSPAHLARQAADAIEDLAFATMARTGGPLRPAEISTVLAEFTAITELLPQVAQQLASLLDGRTQAWQSPRPGPAARNGPPVSAVATATYWLEQVGDLADGLHHIWIHARIAIDRLAPGEHAPETNGPTEKATGATFSNLYGTAIIRC